MVNVTIDQEEPSMFGPNWKTVKNPIFFGNSSACLVDLDSSNLDSYQSTVNISFEGILLSIWGVTPLNLTNLDLPLQVTIDGAPSSDTPSYIEKENGVTWKPQKTTSFPVNLALEDEVDTVQVLKARAFWNGTHSTSNAGDWFSVKFIGTAPSVYGIIDNNENGTISITFTLGSSFKHDLSNPSTRLPWH
ncbi:hypothetical protein L218DRAFT_947449 [Marasmius fiardii PR-910]|nr:hypothetical protein L218DRAFT_947449 [Marasmius fiardii PR-910]